MDSPPIQPMEIWSLTEETFAAPLPDPRPGRIDRSAYTTISPPAFDLSTIVGIAAAPVDARIDFLPVPGEYGDAVAALGGSAAARSSLNTAIPSADTALVNYASRQGRDANIRQVVAQEDEEFRDRRGRFTSIRVSKKGLYEQVYRPQTLDFREEWWRWKRAGVRTPAAPGN